MHTDIAAERSIDDLISGGHTVAMVMTMVGNEHTSRPVTCVEVGDDRLSFLVNGRFDWVEAIARDDAVVHVTVADEGGNTYVALNGRGSVTTDAGEKARLWTTVAKAWFEGPEDPDLAVFRFEVSAGEYWDGPNGKIGQALALARSVLTGDDSALGDQGPVVGNSR